MLKSCYTSYLVASLQAAETLCVHTLGLYLVEIVDQPRKEMHWSTAHKLLISKAVKKKTVFAGNNKTDLMVEVVLSQLLFQCATVADVE